MLKSKLNRKDALKAHALQFTCLHENTVLTKRQVTGGSYQIVYQCSKCGHPTSSPISKDEAKKLSNGKSIPPFDNALKENWDSRKKSSMEDILQDDKSEFWSSYDKYLSSKEWSDKRKLVFNRANNLCEGCLSNPAEEVHHINYEHVGNEFLFELVAVCSSCHNRLHEEK